jgi:integrase
MAVYKRGDKGIFYMNLTVNGVRVFRSTGKFTKKEAKQVEALERQKLLDAEKMSPQERAAKTLLSEAIAQVYQARWKTNKDGDFSHSRALRIMELIGDIPVGKIDQDKVELLTQLLDTRKITPSTVNRYLAILKTILRHKRQQWDHIKLRKERKGRIRVIAKDEEKQVVSLLRNGATNKRNQHFPEVADLVEVLLSTGLRLGELLALKYDDVNFETNLISIWINKGERPRSIPMTSTARSILERRKAGNPDKPFAISSFQAENAWKWVRKQMGLEKDREFVLHHLRHSFASRLAGKDISLYVIKELLGHSTIQVTEKYAHLAPGKLAEAVLVLEN